MCLLLTNKTGHPCLNLSPICTHTPVSSNGYTFVNSISGAGDDVVELIGHAPRAGDVGHAAWPVQLGCQDVVEHSTCVSDLKTARLYSSNLRHTQIKNHHLKAYQTP